MGHKRKRQSDAADAADTPPSKKQDTTTESHEDVPSKQLPEKKEKGKLKQLRSERKSNKSKKDKKVSKELSDSIAAGEDYIPINIEESTINNFVEEQPKTEKRHGQSPRSIRKNARSDKAKELATEEYGKEIHKPKRAEPDSQKVKTNEKPGTTDSKKPPRYICFVGNIPYSATTKQIEAHFGKIDKKAIRHITDKKTGKSKGYAFLEFHEPEEMKTCLSLYHHSLFKPEHTAALRNQAGNEADNLLPRIGENRHQGRLLNIEVTVGGGGKSSTRAKRLQEKNLKLAKSRAKSAKKVAAQEKTKGKGRRGARPDADTGAGGADVSDPPESMGDIHPSRMSRVKG